MLLYRHHAPHVQPVFSQCACLVEAESVDRATQVDTARTDAEDALRPEPFLREHDADRHRRGQRRRHDDRYQVQRTTDYQARATASIDLH